MGNQIAIRWARKPWLAALLLVALGSRLMIPTGFMPGPGGLVLCNGHGPMTTSIPSEMAGMDMSGMDMSGMDMPARNLGTHGGHSDHNGNSPSHDSMGMCPFAAAATAMASPQAVNALILVDFVSTAVEIPPQPFVPRGTIVPTRLPRGPPSLA